MPYMSANGTVTRARFVKLDATAPHNVVQAGAGDRTFGIAQIGSADPPIPQNVTTPPVAGTAGEQINVHTFKSAETEITRLEIGAGGCVNGSQLIAGTGGVGIALGADPDPGLYFIGAIAVEAAAAGELARVYPCLYTLFVPEPEEVG